MYTLYTDYTYEEMMILEQECFHIIKYNLRSHRFELPSKNPVSVFSGNP